MPSTAVPTWSDSLTDRIAAGDFVLFIGSGVSANARNSQDSAPPTWRALLEGLVNEFTVERSSARADVNRLLKSGDFLGAAERISLQCAETSRLSDFRRRIVDLCDGPHPDRYMGGDVHNRIGDLNPPIIVTTNYDRILERHFPSGYAIKQYTDTDIAGLVRTGQPVLLKLHGTFDGPEKTILTRTDFVKLRRDGVHALQTLEALLLTRTALFLGYSLDDPDLQLILENLFGVPQQGAGHYLLGSDKMPASRRQLLNDIYGVSVVMYGGPPADGVLRSLESLVDGVERNRLARSEMLR